MDDLMKSLKAQLYDRVTSPLLSSFLLAWVAWNHRLFVVLFFSKLEVDKRFGYVDETLFPTWREVVGHGFLWPLLSALFILLIYPIPSRWIFERVRADQKKLKEIQQRIEDDTPMTIAEARELRAAIRKAEELADAKDKVIAALRSTVTAQEVTIADQEERLVRQPDTPREIEPELQLSPRQQRILAVIAENRGLQLEKLKELSAADGLEIEHEVDQLLEANLIEELQALDGAYKISSEGRTYLVKHARDLIGRYRGVNLDELLIDG